MKKYSMIVFTVLMSVLLFSPLAIQAGEEKELPMMKSSEKPHMGRTLEGKMCHHDWFSSLNLDEDVLKKIQEMKLKNKERILELKNQIEKKELEMEKLLLDEKLDFKKLLSIHDEISKLRQKISREKIEHKIEIYKLIPDDKKEEARKMFFHRFLRKGHRKPGMDWGKGEAGCPKMPKNK